MNDILYIVDNYLIEINRYLLDKFGCKKSIIVSIVRYYELFKDIEVVKVRGRVILIDRNKNIIGRDLIFDFIKDIVLKYYSKREFVDRDFLVYLIVNKLGIMEEVIKYMVNIFFSVF